MNKRIGLAVVGVGMAAKPHALALKDLENLIDVRGVYSRSNDARSAFCTQYGFPNAGDVQNLARDPTVDALLLITPPNARSELISLFANEGKHILTEKPLERTTKAAEDIVNVCAASGVSLGVVFQHRFRAASETLARLVGGGSWARFELCAPRCPGGVTRNITTNQAAEHTRVTGAAF